MPDSNGASTTLHWVDISDPLALITVQLTRPKWDVHDQQVRQPIGHLISSIVSAV